MTHLQTQIWRPSYPNSDLRHVGKRSKRSLIFLTFLAVIGLMAISVPAFAGQAQAAIDRADAKIEMVTRQAGQAGDTGDQSFNMARQRVNDARSALKSDHYDTAEMLANESSLLAALTVERAVLAALETSHENLLTSTTAPTQ